MHDAFSEKWVRKYMKLAKCLAEDNDACYSRKIGVILVSENNRVISLGYNGSIEKSPHNDDPVYLRKLYENILQQEHKNLLNKEYGINCAQQLSDTFGNCKQCPRRLMNIPSGQHLEYCNCAHAERNCLASASKLGISTDKSTMYCWCSVPCHECTTQMIQSGVKNVVCLKSENDYSKSSRFLFECAKINLLEVDQNLI